MLPEALLFLALTQTTKGREIPPTSPTTGPNTTGTSTTGATAPGQVSQGEAKAEEGKKGSSKPAPSKRKTRGKSSKKRQQGADKGSA
jgi:hypothetical protein